MKKYVVIFHRDAETAISSFYQWGRRVWGDKHAKAWGSGTATGPQTALDFTIAELPAGTLKAKTSVSKSGN